MEKTVISKLLTWYSKNKRDLAWRSTNSKKTINPYYTFVSEYMLQQTTVSTVKNRFEKFIFNWPTINDFAIINENKILSFWSGLGYYSRARNLLKSAKIIKKKFNSKIPENYNDLISLPGIGDYTAKAILGIAYNKSVMPIDANIERILCRLYGFNLPINKIKNEIKAKANNFISKNNSSDLIQSFMDYGSIICKPKKPNCLDCVIKKNCIAYRENLQNIIPLKLKNKSSKRKKYSRAYIFYNEKNEILVRKRSSEGMLPSMLEIPNDNWVINKKSLVYDKIVLKLKNKLEYKGSLAYSFSHFDLSTEVFFAKVKKKCFSNQKWIKINCVDTSSLPTVMKKIIQIGL